MEAVPDGLSASRHAISGGECCADADIALYRLRRLQADESVCVCVMAVCSGQFRSGCG